MADAKAENVVRVEDMVTNGDESNIGYLWLTHAVHTVGQLDLVG